VIRPPDGKGKRPTARTAVSTSPAGTSASTMSAPPPSPAASTS